jgi:hypothetical protein
MVTVLNFHKKKNVVDYRVSLHSGQSGMELETNENKCHQENHIPK